jgi:hypothetical protein
MVAHSLAGARKPLTTRPWVKSRSSPDAKLARVLRELDHNRAAPQRQPASRGKGALENGRIASRPKPRWPMWTWLVTTVAVGAAVGVGRRAMRRPHILDTPDTRHPRSS